ARCARSVVEHGRTREARRMAQDFRKTDGVGFAPLRGRWRRTGTFVEHRFRVDARSRLPATLDRKARQAGIRCVHWLSLLQRQGGAFPCHRSDGVSAARSGRHPALQQWMGNDRGPLGCSAGRFAEIAPLDEMLETGWKPVLLSIAARLK